MVWTLFRRTIPLVFSSIKITNELILTFEIIENFSLSTIINLQKLKKKT